MSVALSLESGCSLVRRVLSRQGYRLCRKVQERGKQQYSIGKNKVESGRSIPTIQGGRKSDAWRAPKTRRRRPLPEIALTHETLLDSQLLRFSILNHPSSSSSSKHMYASLRPPRATHAVHTLKTATRTFSSQMSSSASLDLGAESQLSDKKAVRKQLHSLLSSLPSDYVQRQCPSSCSRASFSIVKLTSCKLSMPQSCSCRCPSTKMLVRLASSCLCLLLK